jgi:hypothetical protein
MVGSEDYEIFFEEKSEEPNDWDWKKQGFWHGERISIKTLDDLRKYLSEELMNAGTICYDITDSYTKKHPCLGEEHIYKKEVFFWEWQSYETHKCYKITETSYLGESPKNVPLSLECFSENNFNSSCFSIGSWERDREGYEFCSVGSRLFDYIDERDLPTIWQAIKEADKWLNERFQKEED